MESKMKKLMMIFAVLAIAFFVSCSNTSEKKETVDTGDTEPTDTGDTGDTDTAEPTDTTDPTNPTEPTDDPTDPTGQEEGSWEAKYKKADDHAAEVSKDVVKANNDLGMKLFNALASEEAGKNMMISPLSISIAMAMVTNGATDESLDEMKEVLGFGEMELPDVNEQFKQLIASLVEADKDMVLEIADSLWLDDAFAPAVKADFISVLEDFYSAALFTEDFADPATVGKINSWVSEKTHEKIDKIIDEIGANTVMYIINAVYFKAAWTKAFDKNYTYNGRFFLSDGSMKETEMMYAGGDTYEFRIDDENKYSIVRIPYGRGVFAFYAIVPSGKIGDFISETADKEIASWFENLRKSWDFELEIPKFRFAYEKSLKETFIALGIGQIFDGGLDNISSDVENLYISDIFHKTFIEIDEEGTEAAAVTAESGDTGGDYTPPKIMAKQPFVFVIRDERTGSILFIGKVEDPTVE